MLQKYFKKYYYQYEIDDFIENIAIDHIIITCVKLRKSLDFLFHFILFCLSTLRVNEKKKKKYNFKTIH